MISKKSVSLVSLALAGVGWLLAVVSSATGGWLACDHDVIEDFNKQACSRIVGHKVDEGIKLTLKTMSTKMAPGLFGDTSQLSVEDMVATLNKLGEKQTKMEIEKQIQFQIKNMTQAVWKTKQDAVKQTVTKRVVAAATAKQKEMSAKLQMAKQIGKQKTKKCQDDLTIVKKAFKNKCFDVAGKKRDFYMSIFDDVSCKDKNKNGVPDCTETSYSRESAAANMVFGLMIAYVGVALLMWMMECHLEEMEKWQFVLSACFLITGGLCFLTAVATFALRYRSYVKVPKDLLEKTALGVEYDPQTIFGFSLAMAAAAGCVELVAGVVCLLSLRMKEVVDVSELVDGTTK